VYPQIFGKYVLERPIAMGGMARVFLATLRGASGFEKKLVVKQIRGELATNEAFVKRFVDEAKTTVELSHPNIVPVYELGVEQGVYYLAMELCDGVTLAELLSAQGRLSPEEGAYLGVEICRALDYAHRKARIIHRDVTPRNVMLDEEGAIRLIDFGIAARAHVGHKEVFGSPGHMPPEQINGGELGPSTDVFAVATLLHEAWSGAPLFRRKTPEESERALETPPAALATIDEALAPLQRTVASALALDPRRRPQTAEELSRELRTFLSGVDAGDVARKLGGQVRAVRADRRSRPPPPPTTENVEEVSTGRSDGATRTFAATRRLRDAIKEPAPQPPDGATRRMADDAASWSTGRKQRASARPSRRARAAGGAIIALLAAGAAMLATKARPRPVASAALSTSPARPEPASAASQAPALDTAAVAPTRNEPGSALPSHEEIADTSSTVAPTRTAASTPAGSALIAPAAPQEAARARILANPEATVEIDGKSRGKAPIDELLLAPGSHRIRMSCAPLGETVSQNVKVTAGEKITIAADFTGAPSRITVRSTP
jgi:serine/threonine-protein kinase